MSAHSNDLTPNDEPSDLGSFGQPAKSGLGSLAQSARAKHIKQARRILIGVGIVIVLFQTAMYFKESTDLKNQEQKVMAGNIINREEVRAEVAQFERHLLLFHGGSIAVGIALIVLGAMIQVNPVAMTATGLVLFIGLQVVFAVVNPANIAGGWIVKIIFIVGLVKALQAALAEQKEARAAAAAEYAP